MVRMQTVICSSRASRVYIHGLTEPYNIHMHEITWQNYTNNKNYHFFFIRFFLYSSSLQRYNNKMVK